MKKNIVVMAILTLVFFTGCIQENEKKVETSEKIKSLIARTEVDTTEAIVITPGILRNGIYVQKNNEIYKYEYYSFAQLSKMIEMKSYQKLVEEIDNSKTYIIDFKRGILFSDYTDLDSLAGNNSKDAKTIVDLTNTTVVQDKEFNSLRMADGQEYYSNIKFISFTNKKARGIFDEYDFEIVLTDKSITNIERPVLNTITDLTLIVTGNERVFRGKIAVNADASSQMLVLKGVKDISATVEIVDNSNYRIVWNLADDLKEMLKSGKPYGEINWKFGWIKTTDAAINLYNGLANFKNQSFIDGFCENNLDSKGGIYTNNDINVQFGIPTNGIAMHPGADNFSSAQWESSINGFVEIETKYLVGDKGDVDLFIYKNNEILFKRIATNSEEEFLKTISIKKGDLVKFIIGPSGFYGWDTTPFSVKIREIK